MWLVHNYCIVFVSRAVAMTTRLVGASVRRPIIASLPPKEALLFICMHSLTFEADSISSLRDFHSNARHELLSSCPFDGRATGVDHRILRPPSRTHGQGVCELTTGSA
jgi:hypothetical protein